MNIIIISILILSWNPKSSKILSTKEQAKTPLLTASKKSVKPPDIDLVRFQRHPKEPP